jgi:1-phosphofructokinase family hexose kinase
LILTLTINPAIDRNVSVDRLVFEDRAYILATREAAGGRGINASCVIQSFGAETVAVAICGGKSGKLLEEFLNACSFRCELVRLKQEIRTNITVADKHGLAVKLNEHGPSLSEAELKQEIRTNITVADKHGLAVKLNEHGPSLSEAELGKVVKAVRQRLKDATWLMLCGSIPPGVPADFYARLIHTATKQGVRTLVDTDGEALEAALDAKPTVVTPNQQEAERLLSRALLTRNHFTEAAERIRGMGARSVVLSLGARGALGAFEDKSVWEAVPPRVDALCPIGAGDAMAAAYVWAMDHDPSPVEALRWGVAAGTASARLPGVSFASLEQTSELLARVESRRLS